MKFVGIVLFLFMGIAVILSSCKKEEIKTEPQTGEWILVKKGVVVEEGIKADLYKNSITGQKILEVSENKEDFQIKKKSIVWNIK